MDRINQKIAWHIVGFFFNLAVVTLVLFAGYLSFHGNVFSLGFTDGMLFMLLYQWVNKKLLKKVL